MITSIDTGYMGYARYAASYLLERGDEAAFIDTNTNAAVPKLLAALDENGVAREAVRYIIITHVHLDHAGGVARVAAECPNAIVLAHPRAAPHIVDPSKLVASATAVYGKETFARLYGEILPVDESRVRVIEDEECVALGGRSLRFLHTRGHANHHFVIHDPASASVFSGDAFGLHYPALQGRGPFAFASTSPTDFDGPLARAAIDRILDCEPERVYPTHFGEVTALKAVASQLKGDLCWAEGVVDDAESVDDSELGAYCARRVHDYFAGRLSAFSDREACHDLLQTDIELNGQGLAFSARRRRTKQGGR